VGQEIDPSLASEGVDGGRKSDDWRMLTGDGRVLDDVE